MFHRRILNRLSLLAYRITGIEQTVNNPQPVTRNRRTENRQRGNNHHDARNLAKHVRNVNVALRRLAARRRLSRGNLPRHVIAVYLLLLRRERSALRLQVEPCHLVRCQIFHLLLLLVL